MNTGNWVWVRVATQMEGPCIHGPLCQLRHYPYRFGLRVLRILPKLQADGCKTFDQMPRRYNPLKSYMAESFDDMWEDAGAPEVLRYIRGNKSLEIPAKWKPHLLPEDF